MGIAASFQTTVTNINNRVRNEINQAANASANTNCQINIDSIRFEKTVGCSITVTNKCFAEASVVMDMVTSALSDSYNNLENNQKQEAAALFTATFGVQTTVNNVVNDFSNYLKQTCTAYAENNNDINIKNVEIRECKAPEGQVIKMEFINSGKSEAICAMKLLNDVIASSSTNIANKQSQGLDWSKLIWPIAIIVVVLSIVYILINLVSKKIPSNEERIEMEKARKDNYSTRIKDLLSVFRRDQT